MDIKFRYVVEKLLSSSLGNFSLTFCYSNFSKLVFVISIAGAFTKLTATAFRLKVITCNYRYLN